MKYRNVFAAIVLASVAVTPAIADQPTTRERLVQYGFLPEPIDPSTIVQREILPMSATEEQLAESGFTTPPARVTARYRFKRQAPDANLTPTEEKLREYGFVAPKLPYRTAPTGGDSR